MRIDLLISSPGTSRQRLCFLSLHPPASIFFQMLVPVEIHQLRRSFTPRPNGWPAPLTCLKAGGPVGGCVEGREQRSGRSGRGLTKEQIAKHIFEEIIDKVFEGGAKGNALCEFLPEMAGLDLPGGGWKEVGDEVLHSQDGGSDNVS